MRERLTEQPLHPWRDRLENLPEGKGNFYYWGPNYTVDPIVITDNSVLLIQRNDCGDWALPGGFVDPNEQAVEAGLRELQEETGLELTDDSPELIYEGPVDDPRSTLHAWPETTALLWRTSEKHSLQAQDDARDAAWVPLSDLPPTLYGSHAALIEQALAEHGSWQEQLAYFGDRCDIATPTGGHMGYERQVISLPNDKRLFIKRHNTNRFSDAEREQHSRDYLRKEFAIYRQLGTATTHIANCHELIGDHTLVLDAYDPRDGWYWRIPNDPSLQARYITDVLRALAEIEQLSFDDTSDIPPAHESFELDGWGSYTENRQKIVALLGASAIPRAIELRDAVDTLYEQHQAKEDEALDRFAHTDLRQSNLAWHPEHGVRIVDWSWAGPSASGLDTTSFLIDLAKAGTDVRQYMHSFKAHHARTLIGFWLGRAILPAVTSQTVRDHQLASAIAAFDLLRRFG